MEGLPHRQPLSFLTSIRLPLSTLVLPYPPFCKTPLLAPDVYKRFNATGESINAILEHPAPKSRADEQVTPAWMRSAACPSPLLSCYGAVISPD